MTETNSRSKDRRIMDLIDPTLMTRRMLLRLCAATCLAVASSVPAVSKDGGSGHDDGGGDDGGHDDGHDDNDLYSKRGNTYTQDEALEGLQGGRIIPLRAALQIAGEEVGGRVIDVNLVRRPKLIYLVTVRRETGRVVTARIDARNGRFLGASR